MKQLQVERTRLNERLASIDAELAMLEREEKL